MQSLSGRGPQPRNRPLRARSRRAPRRTNAPTLEALSTQKTDKALRGQTPLSRPRELPHWPYPSPSCGSGLTAHCSAARARGAARGARREPSRLPRGRPGIPSLPLGTRLLSPLEGLRQPEHESPRPAPLPPPRLSLLPHRSERFRLRLRLRLRLRPRRRVPTGCASLCRGTGESPASWVGRRGGGWRHLPGARAGTSGCRAAVGEAARPGSGRGGRRARRAASAGRTVPAKPSSGGRLLGKECGFPSWEAAPAPGASALCPNFAECRGRRQASAQDPGAKGPCGREGV